MAQTPRLHVRVDDGLPAGLATTPKAYDVWFRAKVHLALEDDRPGLDHQQVMDEVQLLIDRKRHAGA